MMDGDEPVTMANVGVPDLVRVEGLGGEKARRFATRVADCQPTASLER